MVCAEIIGSGGDCAIEEIRLFLNMSESEFCSQMASLSPEMQRQVENFVAFLLFKHQMANTAVKKEGRPYDQDEPQIYMAADSDE